MHETTVKAPGPPPPLDPQCAAALAALPPFPPFSLETVEALRQPPPGIVVPTVRQLTQGGRFQITEHLAAAPGSAPDVPLLIGRLAGQSRARPALYQIHGGGMISGDARMAMPAALEMAASLDLVVVAVEYRLAPEFPHPGPVEDCYAGLEWTVRNAPSLGIDPDRIILVGASAGGGLAAAVALMARDRQGPTVIGQMLAAPMLDDRNCTHSGFQMDGIDPWNRAANEVGWTALLGDARGGPDVSPYAAPARATDLSNLPSTFLDVGSAETFRDEVVDFARRLWWAGARAELHVWPGGFHGYDAIAPNALISDQTVAARTAWLRRLLAE